MVRHRLPIGHGREPAGPPLLGKFLCEWNVDAEHGVERPLHLTSGEPSAANSPEPGIALSDRIGKPSLANGHERLSLRSGRLTGVGGWHLTVGYAVEEGCPATIAGRRGGIEGKRRHIKRRLGISAAVAVGAVPTEERRHSFRWLHVSRSGLGGSHHHGEAGDREMEAMPHHRKAPECDGRS
jgi:hypothetical protein